MIDAELNQQAHKAEITVEFKVRQEWETACSKRKPGKHRCRECIACVAYRRFREKNG